MTTAAAGEIESRFRANLDRVRNLVALYDRLTGGTKGRASVAETDLLRAAVVLLHATLEDLMRALLLLRLPISHSVESFAGIPVPVPPGPSAQDRSTKLKPSVTLVDLAALRGRTVDDLIRDSVASWLEWSNYNAVKDIADVLERIGLPTSLIGPLGGDLDSMMKRRHLIAHRGDASESTGPGHHSARSLSRGTVHSWLTTVKRFGLGVLAAMGQTAVSGGTAP